MFLNQIFGNKNAYKNLFRQKFFSKKAERDRNKKMYDFLKMCFYRIVRKAVICCYIYFIIFLKTKNLCFSNKTKILITKIII